MNKKIKFIGVVVFFIFSFGGMVVYNYSPSYEAIGGSIYTNSDLLNPKEADETNCIYCEDYNLTLPWVCCLDEFPPCKNPKYSMKKDLKYVM